MSHIARKKELADSDPVVMPRQTRGEAVALTASHSERSLDALADLSWPEGPLTLMASDVADLESEKPARTLQDLLELCRRVGNSQVLILDLRWLTRAIPGEFASRQVDMHRVGMLSNTVSKTCRRMGIAGPALELVERGTATDLRITIS